MKTNSSLLLPFLVAGASLWYAISIYPQRRVLTWFEIVTDGMAPDFAAEDARRVMSRIWTRVFHDGHMDSVVKAVSRHIRGRPDVLELAAGSGAQAALWNQALTKEGHFNSRTVITDLQPTPTAWENIIYNSSSSSNNILYIDQPVDATKAEETMIQHYPDWGNNNATQIRMIHFALHHLTPNMVRALMNDAVQNEAVLVIGDLTPSIENMLWTGLEAIWELLWLTPSILKEKPWEVLFLPILPLLFLVTIHDGAVSVLRSYSQEQLGGMLKECTSSYEMESFSVMNLGDIVGFDAIPQLQKPHIQFFVAAPMDQKVNLNKSKLSFSSIFNLNKLS